MTDKRWGRMDELALVTILLLAAALRLPGVGDVFSHPNEWGQSLFLVVARMFDRHGVQLGTVPVFSWLETRPIIYANHPWLASSILSVWCKIWGATETSFRTLAMLFSLLSTYSIFLLGRYCWSASVGLFAAFLFSASPLSVHLGKVYGMESVCLTFLLLFLYHCYRWQNTRLEKDFAYSSMFLVLVQLSDVYGLIYSPFFVAYGLRNLRGDKSLGTRCLILGLLPVLATTVWLGILYGQGLGTEALVSGAGRGGAPWSLWFLSSFWVDVGRKLMHGYTLLLCLGGVAGLAGWIFGRSVDGLILYGLWFLPLIQLLACSSWHAGHDYFVQFFGPGLSLLTAYCLLGPKRSPTPSRVWGAVLFSVLFLWQAYGTYHENWATRNDHDVKLAYQVRNLTTDRDLLLGLPPVMAYYVDREFMVPYFFFMRSDYRNTPERFYDLVRGLVERTHYHRVVLFTRFLGPPWVRVEGLDYSRALDGVDGFQRATKPGVDPQVWERVGPLEPAAQDRL